LGTSNSVVTMTFFSVGVNRSDPEMSSTTNNRFHRALGRLHGPWCNQPLTQLAIWLCRAIYYWQIVYVHGSTIASKKHAGDLTYVVSFSYKIQKTLFNDVGQLHELGICQLHFVAPLNKVKIFIYYLYI
jgi:hypothetical protein